MQNEAKYNQETGTGTYTHNSHYGELTPNATIENNSPEAIIQKLAEKSGTTTAANIMAELYYNSHNQS